MARNKPRILFLDIETLPDMDAAFDRWTTLSRWFGVTFSADLQSILCFGYAWDSSPVRILNAWDFPSWKKNINDDREICEKIHALILQADIVVTQNGKAFDWPFIKTRLLLNGLPPLPNVVHIDTKCEAKKHLKLSSNSLGNMAKLFTDEKKMENGGWDLWSRVRRREAPAMRIMSRYCKQDVRALRAIYEKFAPLIEGTINRNLFIKEGNGCPRCGSLALKKHGTRLTAGKRYERVQCMTCEGFAKISPKGKVTVC